LRLRGRYWIFDLPKRNRAVAYYFC